MAQQRDIKYVNKTFSDFRQQLVDYAKNYFPDTYNDFSPTSPGMMFMEMAAYVGDVLSFYQDVQMQETFLQYAQEPANLYGLAYMMGYRPKVTSAATVMLDVYQRIPAKLEDSDYVPDLDYALIVNENAQLQSTTGTPIDFLTQGKVNFSFSSSYDPTEVSVYATAGGSPTEFLLKKQVPAISATVATQTLTVDAVEKFKTYTIEGTNIIGVLDIVDEEGNKWYEVPYLAQDTVLLPQSNASSDKDKVMSTLLVQKTPRRFVTRFTSTGALQIQFGAGVSDDDDSVITPDPTNVGMGVNKIDVAYDPSNFMFTGAYGLAPSSNLTIRYMIGGGIEANVPSNTITRTIAVEKSFNGSVPTSSTYYNSLQFDNPQAAAGGKDGDTVEEIRQNSLRAYSEQLRTVTKDDYAIRALSLPARFGSIAKAYVVQDQLTSSKSANDQILDSNPLALSIYILAYDNNRNLVPATTTLKENLKKYLAQYKLVTDAVNIKDAFVINVGIKYDLVLQPEAIGRDVLLECNEILRNHFDITSRSINQPINISKLYSMLDRVKGVQTVNSIEITNKVGGSYSQYAYDIQGATRNNIVYPSYDPCIFEVKLPNSDIIGRVTTL